MNSALRRAGETLNFLIKLNSRGFVFCGAFLIAGGALVAIALSSPWPLLAIFPGLQLMFRLVRDLARSRYAELAKSDALRLGKSWQEIYGVVGRHFVVGPIEDATIDIIECLLQGDPDGVMFDGETVTNPVQKERVQVWQIDDIERIEFTSGKNACVVSGCGNSAELTLSHESVRKAVLDMLHDNSSWVIRTEERRAFVLNPGAVILCLPVACFGVVTLLTSAGLIGMNQVPLLRLADLRKRPIRGKGGALALGCSVLCEGYVFVVEQLHPALGFLVGTVVTAGVTWLIVTLQWQKFVDTVWSCAGDPGGAGDVS
jgi:hypothetical protein